jgi:oligosaccharide 4-alpha-D-glucosyltransferase
LKPETAWNIIIRRENHSFSKRGEAPDVEEVDFVVHPINRTVNFVWVNGIKYTGKNYMHEGKLIVPLNFREDRSELKIEWN